jgi:hypothetical protein
MAHDLDLNLPDVVQPGFALRAALDGNGLELRLTGSADSRATSELEAFLGRAHAAAQRLAVPEVVIDLRQCRFMNSSSFKAFLGWLAAIADLPPEARYRLRFAWDAGSYWQRRGLQALRAYATELVVL